MLSWAHVCFYLSRSQRPNTQQMHTLTHKHVSFRLFGHVQHKHIYMCIDAGYLYFLIKSCGDKNPSKYFQTDKINHFTVIDWKSARRVVSKIDEFLFMMIQSKCFKRSIYENITWNHRKTNIQRCLMVRSFCVIVFSSLGHKIPNIFLSHLKLVQCSHELAIKLEQSVPIHSVQFLYSLFNFSISLASFFSPIRCHHMIKWSRTDCINWWFKWKLWPK